MKSFVQAALSEGPWNLGILLLFCAVFLGLLAWILKPSRKPELDQASRLPFND